MKKENEIWRNISELGVIEYGGKLVDMSVYTNYEISNTGKVKSLNYRQTGKPQIMKGTPDGKGYLMVDLYYKGKPKTFTIHRLVALMFIPNPKNLPQINHRNENKNDNSTKNLEWVTAKENINHGTHNKRSKQKRSKQVYQYDKKYNLIRLYPSITEAGRNGFDLCAICNCCNGKHNTHQGFIWSFVPLRKTTIRMAYFGALSINTWKIKKAV